MADTVPPSSSTASQGADAALQELVARVRASDDAAFATLFRAYAERLAVYAYSIVRSREIAEEVVQECFFAIWQRRAQWFVEGTLAQYLYASVRNRALDARKRHARQDRMQLRAQQEELPPAMARPEREPLGGLEDAELAGQVRRAMASLPEQQRAVIQLRWIDQLTHLEIAHVLGISVRTSENHASRAMRRLRELLTAFRQP